MDRPPTPARSLRRAAIAMGALALLLGAFWLIERSTSEDGQPGSGPADSPVGMAAACDDVAPVDADSLAAAAAASRSFGLGVLGAVAADAGDEPNVLVSPLNLSLAFQLLANGADEGTDAVLLDALGFDGRSVEEATDAMTALACEVMAAGDDAVQVLAANAVFTEDRHEPSADLTAIARDRFGAELTSFDAADPDGTAEAINGWTSDATLERIEEIIDAGQVTPDLAMVLVSALTFDGTWQEPFDPEQTRDDTFERADGSSQPVRMMLGDVEVAAVWLEEALGDPAVVDLGLRGGGTVAARIPYGDDGRFGATIVVPADPATMAAAIGQLDADAWIELQDALAEATRERGERGLGVQLPRMQVESNRDLLEPYLLGLGVPRGTYNRLVEGPSNDLELEFVQHAVMIAIDEEGTEAAAATAIGIAEMSLPPFPTAIRADRPFLLIIDDAETGAILFAARIDEPGDLGT